MPDLVFFAQGSTTPVGVEGVGATLVAGTTYYADISTQTVISGVQIKRLFATQWKWDASIIITSITYESTNFDEAGTTLNEAAGTEWFPEGTPTASAPGGTAATVMHHFSSFGAARLRAKVVVGGTGGVLRGRANHRS